MHSSTTVVSPAALIAAIFSLGAGAIPSASAQSLATRLTERLDRPPLDRHLWGVAVLDDQGRLLFGRNAERLFTPASNTKLVVTSVAATLLPPDWSVPTSVFAGGPLRDGVLTGDLVLYGGGDPSWGKRCFAVDTLATGVCDPDPYFALQTMARLLRERGLRAVHGDLVADGSVFEGEGTHPTWETDDIVWGYAAPVSGLGFNENVATLWIAPAASPGAPAALTLEPDLGALWLDNRTVTVSDSGPRLRITRLPGTSRVTLTGSVRLGAPPRRELLAVPDGNLYTGLAFRRALEAAGIAVLGTVRSTADSLTTLAARAGPPLAMVRSRPLSDWIFAILNVSQNWFAETLLKQLGRTFGAAGTWDEGLAVERRVLIDSMGVDSTQFLLHDGSGLSAKDLISPMALATILRYMRGRPNFRTFAAGLPRSGRVGSLRTRFVGTPLEGLVRAKTGSIGQVNTLSGYIERDSTDATLSGPPHRIFSVQANHHALRGRAMIRAIDSVVVEIGRPH